MILGSRTKNASKSDVNVKLSKLDSYIRMHFDQINETMLQGFMRFEAMIEVLLENNIVEKEKYSNKLKEIFEEMQRNMIPPDNSKGATATIDLSNAAVGFEQEKEDGTVEVLKLEE